MSSIGIHAGTNMGGLVAFFVINIADLAAPFEPMLMPVSGHVIESPISLQMGKQIDFIGFAQDKGSYSFEHKQSLAGVLITDRVSIVISEIAPEIHNWLYAMWNTDNIVIAVDNNHKAVIIGSSNYPVRMSSVGGTGSGPGGENNYSITFECQKPYMSRFYLLEEIIPPDLPTRKVYNEGFNFGYLRTW